ncbi:hypothetical protein IH979_03335 [Patescibacteria group bacterium]|nr:hypothetical protein [Patescibacteria group bacterium]
MKKPARFFNCKGCYKQTIICSHCDSGQQYCSNQCSPSARRISCRAANTRYQNTYQGRLKHAARQRRYRERQQQKSKEVTDHTSPENNPHDVLPVEPNEIKTPQTAPPTEGNFCHFCKKPVSDFLRPNFLDSDRGISLTTKLFRKKSLIKLTGET